MPSSKAEMATIGPIVRNEIFFFMVILGAAALVVLREWFGVEGAGRGTGFESGRAAKARMGISAAAGVEFCGCDLCVCWWYCR